MSDYVLDRSPPIGAPIAILGVPFDNVTTAQTIAMIEQMIASREPHHVVTANVDFLVQAREDVELRRILFDAHLVLCDGTPLLWASRWLGNPLPERVAGSDLVPLLIQIAEEKNYRLFFLGAAPEAADEAVTNLKQKFPRLNIVGHYSPPFKQLLEMNHDEITRRISEARADLLFVSFGCPKQEKWIAMHYRSLGVPVTIGVGATIDFLAGRVKRAPVWMQHCGTEWIFRLAQEPQRLFRRYAKDLGVFGWSIATQWWQLRGRLNGKNGELQIPSDDLSGKSAVMPVRLDCDTVQNEPTLRKILDNGDYLLDMSRVEFLDSTGVGFLIQLQKKVHATGRELVLISPGKAVRQALKLMRLEEFFSIAPDFPAAEKLVSSQAKDGPVIANGALFWQGEVTAANADDVWRQTQPYLAGNPTKDGCVFIDLTRLRFIDSTGIGIMIRAKKLARQNGIRVVFTGAQPAVQNVIHIARLESFLQN